MKGARHARRTAHRWSGAWGAGSLVALAVAVGMLTGLRSIATVELPGLRPLLVADVLPRETLATVWTESVVWPDQLQSLGLQRLVVVLGILFMLAALVATLNAAILLAESAGSRRTEIAVRSAVGAAPMTLVTMMARELRTLLIGGAVLGLLGGMSAGTVIRLLWPAGLVGLADAPPLDLASAIGVVAAFLVGAYLAGGLDASRSGRAASVLRAGVRNAADPEAVFVRKALAATHVAVAGTALIAAWTVAGAVERSAGNAVVVDDVGSLEGGAGAPAAADPERTMLHEVVAGDAEAWPALLAEIAEIPGLEAESLAAPGAVTGLGIVDIVIAECGNCYRGGLPAPLWNAYADHYSVGPGYLELAGLALVDGRDFTTGDTAISEPVVLVNETFARSSFEKGAPIGRKVRIGAEFGNWFTVVGIVRERARATLGADETPREAVYMSALQRPPRAGHLLLRGDDAAIVAAGGAVARRGWSTTGARSLADHRALGARPLAWAYAVSLLLASMALVLAGHGVHTTALQTTRRRRSEISIRRAVGAGAPHIVGLVLGGRARVTAWGLAGYALLGTLVAALLQNAAAMPPARPVVYALVAAAMMAGALVASSRAVREALQVEPAASLE